MRDMQPTVLLAVGVTGLTCSITALLLYYRAREAVSHTASASELAQVSREVAGLSRALQEKTRPTIVVVADKNQQQLPAPSATKSSTETDQETAALDMTAKEQRERLATEHQIQLNELKSTLASEPIDVAWSKEATTLLKQAYSSDEFSKASFAIDCRSTICRIDVTGANPAETRQTLQEMILKVPWEATGMTEFDISTGKALAFIRRAATASR